MKKYKLVDRKDCCVYIENEVPDLIDGVFVHWDIFEWSPSKAKEYKASWAEIAPYLLDKGIKGLYALPPTEFEEKLIRMFGFEDTGLRFRGYKLMRYV